MCCSGRRELLLPLGHEEPLCALVWHERKHVQPPRPRTARPLHERTSAKRIHSWWKA
eukprot:XP_001709208.1 Hypothetical protein GL50803_26900 [Giardia lamblia ATCC 50803]